MFPIKVFYVQYPTGKELAFALNKEVPHGPLPALVRHLANELRKGSPATARQCAKDPGLTTSLIDFMHPVEMIVNSKRRMTHEVPPGVQKEFLGALQKVLEEPEKRRS